MKEAIETDKFAEFRTHVPVLAHTTYLDTSSTGLIPDFVHDGVARYQEDRYLRGGDSIWQLLGGQTGGTIAMMDWAKSQIGQMIGAEKENIVFGNNSSHIYTLLTTGMEFAPGDNVVLVENSWIANRFAWQIRQQDGLEIRYVKAKDGVVLPEDLFALCDARTKAICISLVESFTGFRLDAAAIGAFCKEKGMIFAVDGVQALGVMPVDVKVMGIDFLIGNDYKWMMNYCGTGYGYISPALQKNLKQRGAGWMSDDTRFDTSKQVLRLREDAGRFELGFPTVSGIYGLGLAAENYLKMGASDIAAYVLGLTAYLREQAARAKGVRPAYDFAGENLSSVTVLHLDEATGVTNEMLQAKGIGASVKPAAGMPGCLEMRVSLHYYNNKEDINRLMDVIGK